MLLFSLSKDTLRSTLIQLFGQRLHWSAEDFMSVLVKMQRKVSKQALYKELRRLEEEGMVVRATGSYTLRLTWVLELSRFANHLSSMFLESGSFVSGFEFKNDVEEWEFSDLHRADLFWTQLIIALLQKNPARIIFSWIPHPWFHLVHADREREFWEAMAFYKPKFFISVGGKTPLDREWISLVDPTCAKVSFGKQFGNTSPSICYELHGDYLVVVKIDRYTTSEIERLFSTIPSVEKFTSLDLMKLLGKEGKISIRLERNTPRVIKMRKLFLQHFDLPSSILNVTTPSST